MELRLLHLFGFWESRYRSAAVDALKLRPGNTVVDVGCGTGRNFRYLQEKIGGNGRLTGVDLTKEMLEKAGTRVLRHGWTNVDLLQEDASEFNFPIEADGIISTFMLSTMPEHEKIIEHAAQSLRPGGRLVILDVKEPLWPSWFFKISCRFFYQPYGTLYEHLRQKPWETMKRHFKSVTIREFYAGAVYMAAAEI